jgi:hypothetical protein
VAGVVCSAPAGLMLAVVSLGGRPMTLAGPLMLVIHGFNQAAVRAPLRRLAGLSA